MSDEVIDKVLQSDELPTLPTVASKLITLTAKEDTTLSDIADLISRDISLSSKILKVSNSSFYSFPQQIGSIQQAVSILGTNAVRSLVLSFSFLSMGPGRGKTRFNFKQFWQRSLARAVASKLILEKVKGADVEEILLSGLLQNLGELIFARTFPEKYDTVLQSIENDQYDAILAEKKHFGVNHCRVGYEVARNWGFPKSLLIPILHHHTPDTYDGNDTKVKQTVYAVYLSDLLSKILYSNTPDEHHRRFQKEARKLLHLQTEDIETILDNVHIQVEEAGDYFGLKIKNTRSIQEILQEANIRLSLLNLDYDQMNKQLIQTKIELENLTRELQEKNKILDNLAHIDGLTEVYNHRYFQNTLDQELSRAERNDSSLSLILCDIDHFKKFNDTFGHQTGDLVLKKFSSILQSCIRRYDTLARYGGEEFVIILPETESGEAYEVSEKLRKAIDDAVIEDGVERYSVTASFGLASCHPNTEDDCSKDRLIQKADEALYTSKNNGRNCSTQYTAKKKWFSF